MTMLPPLGPTLKETDAVKWMASLRRHLAPGEEVKALARFSTMRPMADAIAVTDRRLITFFSTSVSQKGPLVEIASSEIGRADATTRSGGRTLTLHALGRASLHVGGLRADDVSFVVEQVNAIAAAREPATPTVEVYDPFSKPWDAPSAAADVPRPQFVTPPVPERSAPELSLADVSAVEPMNSVGGGMEQSMKRLVSRWKTVPLLFVAAFFGLLAVAGAFDREAGLSLFMGLASFTLVPVLVLTSIRRRAARRRAEAAGSIPVYGFFERNWVPIGIPLAIVLFIAGVAIG